MKKRLLELEGYIINNPFYHEGPLKHIFMKNMFLWYRKMRMKLARFFPLADWQELMWKNYHFPCDTKSNEAKTVNSNHDEQCVSPVFIVENIQIISPVYLILFQMIQTFLMDLMKDSHISHLEDF